jgi:hypothetical protein
MDMLILTHQIFIHFLDFLGNIQNNIGMKPINKQKIIWVFKHEYTWENSEYLIK